MKVLLLALIVSVGVVFLLYRALCAWAQNNMRNAMCGEGQMPRNTPGTHSSGTGVPRTTPQDNDDTRSPC
jgi:hypothetical protein